MALLDRLSRLLDAERKESRNGPDLVAVTGNESYVIRLLRTCQEIFRSFYDRASHRMGKEVVFRADAAFAKPESLAMEQMRQTGLLKAVGCTIVLGQDGKMEILANIMPGGVRQSPRPDWCANRCR